MNRVAARIAIFNVLLAALSAFNYISLPGRLAYLGTLRTAVQYIASYPGEETATPRYNMVLADLGKRLNNALGQLSKASVVDDQVSLLVASESPTSISHRFVLTIGN
jgi:hypothetical protein